ncbi:MAG: SIS domain-containing protein, partial [Mesorhizobium sp.]
LRHGDPRRPRDFRARRSGRHSFLGYLIEADGIRIWHSGDCVPFDGLIEEISALGPDLALLPVNGRSVELSSKGIAGNFSLAEAIETTRAIGASSLIAHHHGMFAFNTVAPESIDAAAASTVKPRILRARTNVTYTLASPSMDAHMTSDQPHRARETTPNIMEVVRTLQATLRKSDRKVADLVLADPQRVLDATVAEAAELAGVSQPTVIRFSVAVGCSGYQEFRFRLAQSLALGTPATHSVLSINDAPEAVIEKIFDYTITSLDWARHHLDRAAIARAVELLEKATNIEFFGFGASGIVARDAQQKFPLFGVPCGAQVDSHQQIMAASMMLPGQVAVVISNTGLTRSIIEVARTARGNAASVIAITGSASLVIDHCDVALIVETLDNTNVYTPTISRIAALVVIDVLSTAVALRRDSAQGERFQAMKRQLSELRVAQRL